MSEQSAVCSTGDTVLDDALHGGIPPSSSVLLTGGPGTGKTTLAMQFLQAGLAEDEQCLFISTEQATGDLERALAPFEFELSHPTLQIVTVHAGREQTLDGRSELVIRSLDGGQVVDRLSVSFTPENVAKYLEQFAPVDRVVLDSASGLAALTDHGGRYRRAVLDLVRLFKRTFGATSILTAQEYADHAPGAAAHETLDSSLPLQFTVDGVIKLWQEPVEGQYQRYLHVTKMRGVDHDTRSFEISLTEDGVRVTPMRRSPASDLWTKSKIPTGLDGLDELLGGGLVEGGLVTYLHDSDVHMDLVIARLLAGSIRADRDVVLAPPPSLTYDQLTQYSAKLGSGAIDDLLTAGRFRILDLLATGNDTSAFVSADRRPDGVETLGQKSVHGRLSQMLYKAERSTVCTLSTHAGQIDRSDDELVTTVDALTSEIRNSDHTMLFLADPALLGETLTQRLVSAGEQVLAHKRRPSGIEQLRLRKGFGGEVGASRTIEYLDGPPYFHVT